MSSAFGNKIKLMRQAEGLTHNQMCELVDIKLGTLKGYENSGKDIPATNLNKIFSCERFKKYLFWFWTGKGSPVIGQFSPGSPVENIAQSFKEGFLTDAQKALAQMGAMGWFSKTDKTDLREISRVLFLSCHPEVNRTIQNGDSNFKSDFIAINE